MIIEAREAREAREVHGSYASRQRTTRNQNATPTTLRNCFAVVGLHPVGFAVVGLHPVGSAVRELHFVDGQRVQKGARKQISERHGKGARTIQSVPLCHLESTWVPRGEVAPAGSA